MEDEFVPLKLDDILHEGDIIKIRPASEIDGSLGAKFPPFMHPLCGHCFQIAEVVLDAGCTPIEKDGITCTHIYRLKNVESGPFKTSDDLEFNESGYSGIGDFAFQNHMLYALKYTTYRRSVLDVIEKINQLF